MRARHVETSGKRLRSDRDSDVRSEVREALREALCDAVWCD